MIDDSKSFEESVEDVDLFERYLKKLSKFDLSMLVFALMIIKYYEVIDEVGNVITHTHFLKDAKKSKEEYEEKENDE